MNHFLHSLGLLQHKEPFKRLLVQGMVMGQSYRIKGSGKYLSASDVTIVGKDFFILHPYEYYVLIMYFIKDAKRKKAVHKTTNEPVVMAWEKMSKSKHNGVDPDDMFNTYGVDTTRLLILADVAPTSHRNWQPSSKNCKVKHSINNSQGFDKCIIYIVKNFCSVIKCTFC